MKFSTTGTPESFSPPPKPKHYFLAQPHQPFFFFGMVWAIVSMVLFTLSHKGTVTLSIAENLFHLYSLSFLVLIQFFHGFLFTTFPRFCMSEAISKEEYRSIVWLYQIFGLLFFLGSVASEWTVFAAMVGMLAVQAMAYRVLLRAYRTGKSPQKSDPFWILIAHSIGLGAHAVLVITFAAALSGYSSGNEVTAISPVVTHLFLVFLTFIAAQRMIPFFSHSMEVRAPYFVARVFALLVVKTGLNLAMLPLAEAAVSLLLGSYLLREFLRWKLPLFQSSAILWILYLALFWLPIGFIAGGLMQLAEVYTNTSWLFGGTHLLVLGFITTVLIGFGTRVTLGHSGQTPHANNLTIAIFWWTQIVVLSRFALSADTAFGATHQWLFDIASGGLILLFTAWSILYGKTLVFGKKL